MTVSGSAPVNSVKVSESGGRQRGRGAHKSEDSDSELHEGHGGAIVVVCANTGKEERLHATNEKTKWNRFLES